MKYLTLSITLVISMNYAKANDVTNNDQLYRQDQPQVLKTVTDIHAKNRQSEALIVSQFKTSYQRASLPKFLMLWHRELSDNINSNKEINSTVTSTGETARNNYNQIINVQWKDGSERAVSLLPPAQGAEFESGFQQTLRNAGVKLVDRNTAIRMTALTKVKKGGNENDFNFQTIEAQALEGYAGYFVEVRFVPDTDAKNGNEPRVTVINSSTGEIVVDFVPSTLYKTNATESQWIATNEGFVKQVLKKGSAEEGRAVAVATMKALTDVWGGSEGK